MGNPSAGLWERYREAFARDGSLRDIYVRGTDEGDWRTLLESLRTSPYECEFTVDGERRPLPGDVNALFAPERRHAARLVLDGSHLGLYCHFFAPTEIEFDLNPQAVAGDEQLGRLLGFLRWLGLTLGKAVLLTPENGPDFYWFRFDPATGTEEWWQDRVTAG